MQLKWNKASICRRLLAPLACPLAFQSQPAGCAHIRVPYSCNADPKHQPLAPVHALTGVLSSEQTHALVCTCPPAGV